MAQSIFALCGIPLDPPATTWGEAYERIKRKRMNFGQALDALKQNRLVAREGWNGKGMFLYFVPGSRFAVSRAPLLGIFPEGTAIDYRAHIDMKAADGTCVPWLASQTDLLAEDWEIVPPPATA